MTSSQGLLRATPWILPILLLFVTSDLAWGQRAWNDVATSEPRVPEEIWADEEPGASSVTAEASDGHAWYLMGRTLYIAGEYEAAIGAWMRAEALQFALPYTRYNLAAAHSLLGDVESAFTWLDKALEAGFAEVDLLVIDDDLANLRDDSRFSSTILRAYENRNLCEDSRGKNLDSWVRGTDETRVARFASLYHSTGVCSERPAATPTRRLSREYKTSRLE